MQGKETVHHVMPLGDSFGFLVFLAERGQLAKSDLKLDVCLSQMVAIPERKCRSSRIVLFTNLEAVSFSAGGGN